jgi:hypothetical protein
METSWRKNAVCSFIIQRWLEKPLGDCHEEKQIDKKHEE